MAGAGSRAWRGELVCPLGSYPATAHSSTALRARAHVGDLPHAATIPCASHATPRTARSATDERPRAVTGRAWAAARRRAKLGARRSRAARGELPHKDVRAAGLQTAHLTRDARARVCGQTPPQEPTVCGDECNTRNCNRRNPSRARRSLIDAPRPAPPPASPRSNTSLPANGGAGPRPPARPASPLAPRTATNRLAGPFFPSPLARAGDASGQARYHFPDAATRARQGHRVAQALWPRELRRPEWQARRRSRSRAAQRGNARWGAAGRRASSCCISNTYVCLLRLCAE